MSNEHNKPASDESQPPRDYQAVPRDGPALGATPEVAPDRPPRIYVASLSDYVSGHLHGRWIDASAGSEEIRRQVTEMLASSMTPGAEETAVHDYDGFGPIRIDEYESLEVIARLAEGIVEHGPAFAHWASVLDRSEWDEELDRFDDHYQGAWSSMTEYAEELLDGLGISVEDGIPEYLRAYVRFDIEVFARDLAFDYRVSANEEGGVYVFDC